MGEGPALNRQSKIQSRPGVPKWAKLLGPSRAQPREQGCWEGAAGSRLCSQHHGERVLRLSDSFAASWLVEAIWIPLGLGGVVMRFQASLACTPLTGGYRRGPLAGNPHLLLRSAVPSCPQGVKPWLQVLQTQNPRSLVLKGPRRTGSSLLWLLRGERQTRIDLHLRAQELGPELLLSLGLSFPSTLRVLGQIVLSVFSAVSTLMFMKAHN